jgi:hypothetical protein
MWRRAIQVVHMNCKDLGLNTFPSKEDKKASMAMWSSCDSRSAPSLLSQHPKAHRLVSCKAHISCSHMPINGIKQVSDDFWYMSSAWQPFSLCFHLVIVQSDPRNTSIRPPKASKQFQWQRHLDFELTLASPEVKQRRRAHGAKPRSRASNRAMPKATPHPNPPPDWNQQEASMTLTIKTR